MSPLRIRRRPRVNRAFVTFVLGAFVVGAGAAAYALRNVPPRRIITGHARIIDGDSLYVAGTEIRLHGMDAPELFQRCRRDGREVLCGREAQRQLIALIAGQTVSCERRDVDRYGRTVAVCRVDGVDLGRAMVSNGQAVSYGAYLQEEAAARRERKGLWAGEFMRPREWRDQERGRLDPGA
jgi:endonuclease YncB( thermonuclease family)